MCDVSEETRRLLELEYLQVRGKIDRLDQARFTLKGWAITITGALMALGVQAGRASVVLLSLLVAVPMALVEADYLARQQSLTDRSDHIEGVMESMRRHGYGPEARAYVFGTRAVSLRGASLRRMPEMFGGRSRAGNLYAVIVVAVIVVALML
jgi:hypothetical protein